MPQLFVLFEHAVGYCLFKVREFEEVGAFLPQVEASVTDSAKFKKLVQLTGFQPFTNAAAALENINAVSEGILTDFLGAFLSNHLPNPGKKGDIVLGVCDPKLGAAINENLTISVSHIGAVPEIIRGIRTHLTNFIQGLNAASMKQTELGLGHSYSRGKVKFNVHKADNMIIQSIALVDQLDKDINTFSMRIREWYSYHFPELAKVVTDNYQYALCAHYIKNRLALNESMLEDLETITMDSAKAQAILDAGRMSMGMDISPIDLLNIEIFAKKVANMAEYRKQVSEYLREKMGTVAPNLSTLIGDIVGARLISHAGSLTNLAKYPASTVQILGAEKALFRALKSRGNTPKYGLIFHSSYIGRAASTNKGRISRYLANKCSIATRIDCFSETPTTVFGEKLRDQVEERLKFYEKGDLPRKNIEVMTEAIEENNEVVKHILHSEKKKKRKLKALQNESNASVNGSYIEDANETGEFESPSKKKKKNKKAKESNGTIELQEEADVPQNGDVDLENSSKKKKKKKKKHDELNGSMLDSSAFNSTMNSTISEEVEEGAAISKKKKKRKSQP